MSRKRYISTDISTDAKLVDLSEHGFLPLVLYTWSIPHMDDWGRITGDAQQFKLIVCPGIVISVDEVDKVIELIVAAGLWIRYEVDGKKCISIAKSDKWFKHQSYINKSKRTDDTGSDFPGPNEYRKTPQNAEEHQEIPKITENKQDLPQNTVSFSSSFPVSSSPSKDTTATTMDKPNSFKLYETEKFGFMTPAIAEEVGALIDENSDEFVERAIVEASLSGVRTIKYVKGILRDWKATNHPEPWTLEKVQQSKQSNVKPFQRYNKPQKPDMPIVTESNAGSQKTIEEREAMRQLVAEMEQKKEVIQ